MSNDFVCRTEASDRLLPPSLPILAMLLASCIRRRREELGLSDRARRPTERDRAVSSGMPWRPAGCPDLESGLLEAIAGTLEASFPNCPVYRRRQQRLPAVPV